LTEETQDITSSDVFHAIAIVHEVYELTKHTFDPNTPTTFPPLDCSDFALLSMICIAIRPFLEELYP
jgi:hypothetical protein